ncbi:MAG: ABC transporter ATP-binding protein [Acidimicrobiia bacterium]|nr:ABC transporter ATP-binding protein [Acidimicrobiia bacterium]
MSVTGWGGGFFGGPQAQNAARDAGLPHGGVPGNLINQVEAVLAKEPAHPAVEVNFSHRQPDDPPLTLRSFLWPHRDSLAIALLLVILETAMMQTGPLLTQIGIDRGIIPGNFDVLLMVVGIFLASVIVHMSSSSMRIRFTGRMGERLIYALRIRVFSHYQRMSLNFYTDEKAGVLMTRMTSDLEALTMLFQEGLINFAVQALTLMVITIVLYALNPSLATLTLFVVVPATFALSIWFRHVSNHYYDLVRDRIAEVLSDLQESLAGIRVIAAHNRHLYNVINHTNVVGRHKDANLQGVKSASVYGSSAEAIGIIGQAIVLVVGGYMVFRGSLTEGELVAFVLYLTAFFAPIQQLVQLYNAYQQGQASMRKLSDLLKNKPSVIETANAKDLPPIQGEIVFKNVSFSYDPAIPVLHDINLQLAPGESLAIVGPTGAGKSTVAKLITRFYDPQQGVISIDGHDLRNVTLASLRRQLGVVPQEPFLFYGSIYDNVAFARPDTTTSEVLQTCQTVGLTDLLERLPNNIYSQVHERGASLSAGERQLLALARALLARPRVLVLDEATSNLDMLSESQITAALDAVLEERTAIIIAHRLATAMRANRIAVVENGRITEIGTHEELIAHSGHYAEMYATWMAHVSTRGTSHATSHDT